MTGGGRLPRFARNDGGVRFTPSGISEPRSPKATRNDGGFKGFTLLELLVVIGIIGVLTALATVAYSTTQVGGRNARRKQDLIAVQNALEQFYSANSFAYPVADCTEAVTYLKASWPADPLSTVSIPKSYLVACAASSYCVCGEMEGSSVTRGNSGLDCDWSAADKGYYCVGNLQ